MRPENFIFFLSSCGFFIGIIFGVLADFEPMGIIYSCAAFTALFYMIGLCAGAFFIRALDIKAAYTIDSEYYETQLDKARAQIERREVNIRDATRFIRVLEQEIASAVQKDETNKVAL
ncbi:MAG: hypothetical protein LBU73_10355 [Helicobacteraceae bacterium]|jgi:hypothetical protein|nr:hypothetical protein [Helicobacteraceae bacterium]